MPHALTEKEKLRRKLVRKINAYAAAKVAESWKYEVSNTGREDEIEHELRLQRNQLNKLIESIFEKIETEDAERPFEPD